MKLKKAMQPYNFETMSQCLPLSSQPSTLKQKMSSCYFRGFSQADKGDKYYLSMKKYLISRIKSPDIGSQFAENNSWVKLIPANVLLKIMLFLRYDAVFL